MQWASFSDWLVSHSAVSSRFICSTVSWCTHPFHGWIISPPISKSPFIASLIPQWTRVLPWLQAVGMALLWVCLYIYSSSPSCSFFWWRHTWSLIWLPGELPVCCWATCHSPVPSAMHRGSNLSTSGQCLFFPILKATAVPGFAKCFLPTFWVRFLLG